MLKKIICLLFAAMLFTLPVFAENDIKLSPGKEFTVCTDGENIKATAKILGLSETELRDYCAENSIAYLAVNGENSKQIRVICDESPFSGSVVNLSNLENDKITALLPDITGDKAIRGEIVEKNGQKFVKTQLSSRDSGGEYTVTSYITVAAKKEYILSVYTDGNADDDFAETVFDGFTAEDFYSIRAPKSNYGYIIEGAIVLLALGTVYIIFTLVRDIKNDRITPENEEQQTDNG